jgi:hypothetical protein
VVEEVLEV